MRWYRPASTPRSSHAARSRSSTGTAAATGRARRHRSTRTSGCGTRASSRSGSPASTPSARPASCARCSAGSGRTACCRTCSSPPTFPTWAAPGSGSHGGIRCAPDDIDDVVHHATAGHRDRRVDGRAGPARRRPVRVPRRGLPEAARRSRVALPRARSRRHRPGHADPPVGVRARHHPAVDARRWRACPRRGGRAAATRLHVAHLLRFLRRDTKYVPSVQRPTDDEGLRMLVLARLAKRYGFELRRMPRDRSVLIQDLAFNSILAAANRSLALIAAEVGEPIRRRRCSERFAAHARRHRRGSGTTMQVSTSRATRSPVSSFGCRPSRRSYRCSRACRRPNARGGWSRGCARRAGSGRALRCRRCRPTRPSSSTRRIGRARRG